jgi:glycosyltransferase involved in cell wall biosynthesis
MRILYLVHQYLPRHLAGTEVYTHSLAKALSARHEVLVYCHEPALDGGAQPAVDDALEGVAVRRVAARTAGRAPASPLALFRAGYRNRRIAADLAETLARYRPDVVHVQHLKDLTVDALPMARVAGAGVVYTLHDYWGICPNAQYVRPGGGICHGPHLWLECGRCAAYGLGKPWLTPAAPAMIPFFAARQRAIDRAMAGADLFLSPSRFLRDRYVAGGLPAERLRVLENGLDVARLGGCPAERGAFRGHYAYVGSLAWQKGVHVAVEAFRTLGDMGAELRIWGGEHAFPDYARRLRRLAAGCDWIRFEGELDPNRVGEALTWADYLVVPSLWWENSPVTIQEAYCSGVPVLASRLGALEEKVPEGVGGLLFVPGDPADLARTVRRTLAERDLLEALRATLPAVETITAHAEEVEALYEELWEARRGQR